MRLGRQLAGRPSTVYTLLSKPGGLYTRLLKATRENLECGWPFTVYGLKPGSLLAFYSYQRAVPLVIRSCARASICHGVTRCRQSGSSRRRRTVSSACGVMSAINLHNAD